MVRDFDAERCCVGVAVCVTCSDTDMDGVLVAVRVPVSVSDVVIDCTIVGPERLALLERVHVVCVLVGPVVVGVHESVRLPVMENVCTLLQDNDGVSEFVNERESEGELLTDSVAVASLVKLKELESVADGVHVTVLSVVSDVVRVIVVVFDRERVGVAEALSDLNPVSDSVVVMDEVSLRVCDRVRVDDSVPSYDAVTEVVGDLVSETVNTVESDTDVE